jgi:hypothetical protein
VNKFPLTPDPSCSTSTADTADKYRLYTEAVQNPEADVRFFSTLYEQENGRPPVLVREDFCGTAARLSILEASWSFARADFQVATLLISTRQLMRLTHHQPNHYS